MSTIYLTRTALFIVFLVSSTLMVSAQADKPYETMIQGVKVIVQPSGNEIVEIQTILKGGVQNYSKEKEGIETMAMDALGECGTEKDDKNSFKNKLDKINAWIYGNTSLDYSTIHMNCIKGDFEIAWPLFVDVITIPKFDPKEFARIKQDDINFLKMQESNPDYAISTLARQTAFAGKNYAKNPSGTEAILSKLTVEETKAYYKNLLTKSRMIIVVVGDIERTDLEKKINALLSLIPEGKPFSLKKETYTPVATTFKSEKKEFATNYIQAVSGAPLPGSKDYNPFVLAMRIFSNRQNIEVRTKNGLSYAPYSYLSEGVSPTSNIYVSTTEPDKYIGVMNSLINKTKKEGFKEDEVKDMKTTYLTNYYYKLETNAAQANSLVSNEVLQNNWRRSYSLKDDIKDLKPADLNNAFNKYMNKLTWVYQGDPAKVNTQLYLQGSNKIKLSPSRLDTKSKN